MIYSEPWNYIFVGCGWRTALIATVEVTTSQHCPALPSMASTGTSLGRLASTQRGWLGIALGLFGLSRSFGAAVSTALHGGVILLSSGIEGKWCTFPIGTRAISFPLYRVDYLDQWTRFNPTVLGALGRPCDRSRWSCVATAVPAVPWCIAL